MAANAKKDGIKTTESGLQYKIEKEGTGAIPADTSVVRVHYKGTLIDGTEFDSSYKRLITLFHRKKSIRQRSRLKKRWKSVCVILKGKIS